MSEQEIFERLRAILIETFDIEAELIKPEAKLYEDLDIDSIDAVDLIVKLKPLVGRRLQPETFKSVRSLQDVVTALQGLLAEAEPLSPTEAAEERLMLGLRTTEGVALSELAPLDLNARILPLVEDGFLSITNDRLGATPRGRKVLDAVLRALLV